MKNKYILSTACLCADTLRVELDYIKRTLYNLTNITLDNKALERIINRNLFLISGINEDLSTYLFEPNIMRYINDEYDAVLKEVPLMLNRLSTMEYFELDVNIAYLSLAKLINLNLMIGRLDETIINNILNVIDVNKLNDRQYAYYMCLLDMPTHSNWVKGIINVVSAVNNIISYIIKYVPINDKAQTPMIVKYSENIIQVHVCLDARAIAWEENNAF